MKIFTGGIFEWQKTVVAVTLINVLTIILTYLNRLRIPPSVPLYYGNPAGSEQLGPAYGLLIPPFFVVVVLLTSILITKAYKDSFLETLLVLSLVVLTVLSTLTVFKILFLVGNL